MAVPPVSFQYGELPTESGYIRMLRLEWRPGESSPHGKLKTWPLDNMPSLYDALSYAWGDPLPTFPFLCEGALLEISSNLNLALHRLVSPGDSPRYLWIDQICINQNDTKERSNQVKLMHLIYGGAENVPVWLGEAPKDMDLALELMPSIQNALSNVDKAILVTQAIFESHGLPAVSSPVWSTIATIFRSTWFERLWTVQEVVLGRNLKFQMGVYLLDWDLLSSLASCLSKANLSFHMRGEVAIPKDRVDGFIAIQQINRLRQTKTQFGSISRISLLNVARTRECTQAVDRIYALAGLLTKDFQEHCLPVDYESSIQAVFVNYFKLLTQSDTTHWLLNSSCSRNDKLGLPSWCPNICQPSAADTLGQVALVCGYRAGYRTFSANSISMQVVQNSNNILVQGLSIDTVAKVVSLEQPYLGSVDLNSAQQALDWEAECLKVAQEVFDMPNGVPEEHWRTLIASKIHKALPCESDHTIGYNGMKKVLEMTKNPAISFPKVEGCAAATQIFMEAAMLACTGRRYFSTKNGRVGLGPPGMAQGDLVCVFLSGPTPSIIHQSELNSNYKFLGEGYVHGLMNSEALDMMEQGLVNIETFELE